MASLCLQTDRFLRVLLYSGQYLLEQGQGYRVRKQYEVIGIRAGYSNAARSVSSRQITRVEAFI